MFQRLRSETKSHKQDLTGSVHKVKNKKGVCVCDVGKDPEATTRSFFELFE